MHHVLRFTPRRSTTVQLPPTFRAPRHRNFRLFFFGQLISLIGTRMQTIAQRCSYQEGEGRAIALPTATAASVKCLASQEN